MTDSDSSPPPLVRPSKTLLVRYTGMVKWFNNKAGFGFITVCDGDNIYSGKDVFIHYTSIRVSNIQYKYLVQGEYVDFTVVDSESDSHEYQATDVCGVKGGSIMCETRNTLVRTKPSFTNKVLYTNTNTNTNTESTNLRPKQQRYPQSNSPIVDADGFTRVVHKHKQNMNGRVSDTKV